MKERKESKQRKIRAKKKNTEADVDAT